MNKHLQNVNMFHCIKGEEKVDWYYVKCEKAYERRDKA